VSVGAEIAVAAVSVISASVAGAFSMRVVRLERKLAQQAEEQKDARTAQAVLDEYRKPIVEAARRLGNRLFLIRSANFRHHLEDDDGKNAIAAVRTTAYRFAHFFAWREVLFSRLHAVEFAVESSTARAAALIDDSITVLASEQLDAPSVAWWAEEQRAIGELMIVDFTAERLAINGYAHFDQVFEQVFSRWMTPQCEQLLTTDAAVSDRLRLMHWTLWALVDDLDKERLHAHTEWMVHVAREVAAYAGHTETTDRARIVVSHVRQGSAAAP
jgi:hypothetical protein